MFIDSEIEIFYRSLGCVSPVAPSHVLRPPEGPSLWSSPTLQGSMLQGFRVGASLSVTRATPENVSTNRRKFSQTHLLRWGPDLCKRNKSISRISCRGVWWFVQILKAAAVLMDLLNEKKRGALSNLNPTTTQEACKVDNSTYGS